MAYQAKYWNGTSWVAVANASFDTSGLVKTTGNTGTVDLSGAPVVKGAGMDLIVPTSVTGGTFSASGAISFSAAASLSVNGCFTSSYDNYFAVYDLIGTTSSWLHMKMRSAGTDNSAATYYDMYMYASAGTAQTAQRTAQTDGVRVGYTLSTGSISMGSTFNVFAPALARATSVTAFGSSDGTGITMRHEVGLHSTATAFDGFTLTPISGGTITGTLRIYGYHN